MNRRHFLGTTLATVIASSARAADGKPHPLRTRNQIEGNDFSRADLHWTGFRGGVDLTRQRFPTGPEYMLLLDYAARAGAVTELVETIDAGLRPKAQLARQDLEHYAARNNNQIFFRLEDVCGGDTTLAEQLGQVLRGEGSSLRNGWR